MHGEGKLKLTDGRLYEGTFNQGTCNTNGTIKYLNGDIFIGELRYILKK
jgi:hypothetical protein